MAPIPVTQQSTADLISAIRQQIGERSYTSQLAAELARRVFEQEALLDAQQKTITILRCLPTDGTAPAAGMTVREAELHATTQALVEDLDDLTGQYARIVAWVDAQHHYQPGITRPIRGTDCEPGCEACEQLANVPGSILQAAWVLTGEGRCADGD